MSPSRYKIELEDVIERLYQTFGRYNLDESIPGCSHCVFPEDQKLLRSKSLRQLSSSDLRKYIFKAMTTWGGVEHFKHFLPRILEKASVEGTVGENDSEVVFGKLEYANWHEWPAEEKQAVEEFLLALWRAVLSRDVDFVFRESFIEVLACAVDDLSPFLTEWIQCDAASGWEMLTEYVGYIASNRESEVDNAFLTERDVQRQQINEWLISAKTRRKVEEAFFDARLAQIAPAISQAMGSLDALAASKGIKH